MRNVLIVSPRFPPKNAADLHRVRTSLPYYRSFGWNPTVLCLTPESSDGVGDVKLGESLPGDIDVFRVSAWSEERCRRFGFGHIDYRAWGPLFRAGNKLLSQHRYDVVLFSTTVFSTFLMGPIWKRRFQCKIVYDFQDPWYQGGVSAYTKANVPGTWWKYRLVQTLARHFEKCALKSADHVIAVSQGYVNSLSARYPWLGAERFTVLPFGAASEDFNFVADRGIRHSLFRPDKNVIRWVYAGRCGPDMNAALSVFFRQLAILKKASPSFAARLRVYFVGTNYSPPERTYNVVTPLAAEHHVEDMIEEHSTRIPYHETLSLYLDSDAILLIGSIYSNYTPSKLFNCVAAKKPVLALLHFQSGVSALATRFPNVFLAAFGSDPTDHEFATAVAEGIKWLRKRRVDVSTVDREMEPWSAEALTRIQCAIFARVCEQ